MAQLSLSADGGGAGRQRTDVGGRNPELEPLRDESFKPSPFRPEYEPTWLTRDDVARWNRDGFLVLGDKPLLAPAEVELHVRLWEAMFDAHAEGNGFAVNGYFQRYGLAWDREWQQPSPDPSPPPPPRPL